ncbi:hypothetical protein KSP39_PZI023078 [Platanthera zijinensis]|uniref:Peroxiredoxin-like 2A n=1 Tax=Platanthera zijinensis TaxID=2320716 RepID=A0AAP0FUZ5_9ASPA
MSSFDMEEFLGDGVLIGIIPKFIEAGWDDVPALKMINSENMELLKLTQPQKNILTRSIFDAICRQDGSFRIEASRPSKHDHRISLPAVRHEENSCCSLRQKREFFQGLYAEFLCSSYKGKQCFMYYRKLHVDEYGSNKETLHTLKSHLNVNPKYDSSTTKAVLDLKLNEGHVFKGIVASNPADSRLCGCFQPPPVVGDVAPHSSVENISVQKLAPLYKAGACLLEAKSPPMRASDLWKDKSTILLCIRRPGCIMCRAEAHQLYSRKPIFDALGFQLVAVFHEQIESEVKEFWPRYWGGLVVLDQTMGFFKALGGGKLLKDNFLTGFVLNSRAFANYKAAKTTEFNHNFRGGGEIKGGMFIFRRGRGGVAYQFIERNFGDWAPIAEVVEICTKIQDLPSKFVQFASLLLLKLPKSPLWRWNDSFPKAELEQEGGVTVLQIGRENIEPGEVGI